MPRLTSVANDPKNWNQRYRSEPHSDPEPALFLREILPLCPRGRALDLAMGGGRNAVYLAGIGWRVTGLDSSRVALEKAEALARNHEVSVHWAADLSREFSPKLAGLLLLEADLELSPLPAVQFDLIVCFNFLQRSLFASIERALRHGGMLVYETYTVEQLGFPNGPHNPDYLLRPDELRQSFGELQTLFYRELRAGKGIASLLARKP
jgi:tellurite methyltransferase